MSNKKQQKRVGRPAFQLIILFLVITSLFVAVLGIILQKPQEIRKINDFNNIPNISLKFDESSKVGLNLALDVNRLRVESRLNVYSLEVEKSDLFSEAEVEMTPLQELSNLPAGLKFVAGVNITPEGFLLSDISELTISLSPEKEYKNLFGFVYNKENDQLHLFPILEVNGLIKMKISYFNAYGLIEGNPELFPEFELLDTRQIFEDKLGRLDAEIRFQESFTGAYSERDMKNAEQIFVDWYNESLSQEINEFSQNDVLIKKYNEFYEWKEFIKSFNLQSRFLDQISEYTSLVVTSLLNKSNLVHSECTMQYDLLQIEILNRFIMIVHKLDPETNTQFLQDLIAKCLSFELQFESKLSIKNEGEQHDIKLVGKIEELSLNDDMELSGEGIIQIDEYIITGDNELNCRAEMYTAKLQINNGKLNTVMLDIMLEFIVTDNLNEITLECRSKNSKTTVFRLMPNTWLDNFKSLHKSELIEDLIESSFEISAFESVSDGKLLLRKVYSNQQSSLTELTTIKIIHTPK